jgi:hypothetical protein
LGNELLSLNFFLLVPLSSNNSASEENENYPFWMISGYV